MGKMKKTTKKTEWMKKTTIMLTTALLLTAINTATVAYMAYSTHTMLKTGIGETIEESTGNIQRHISSVLKGYLDLVIQGMNQTLDTFMDGEIEITGTRMLLLGLNETQTEDDITLSFTHIGAYTFPPSPWMPGAPPPGNTTGENTTWECGRLRAYSPGTGEQNTIPVSLEEGSPRSQGTLVMGNWRINYNMTPNRTLSILIEKKQTLGFRIDP